MSNSTITFIGGSNSNVNIGSGTLTVTQSQSGSKEEDCPREQPFARKSIVTFGEMQTVLQDQPVCQVLCGRKWLMQIAEVNKQYHEEFYVRDERTPATDWALYWRNGHGTDDIECNWRMLETTRHIPDYYNDAQILHLRKLPLTPYEEYPPLTPKNYN